MDRTNIAYDLSLYDAEQDRLVQRKEKQTGTIIKAQTKFITGKKLWSVLSLAIILSLTIGVISTNASITTCASQIEAEKVNITQIESEKAYLNFSLESRMSLNSIEEYAVNTLGLVKMESSQTKYVELESENKIEVRDTSIKDKLDAAIKPIMSYLLP
ncbi:MAG: hypothetical protein RR253_04315 [Oscillospiraceae bacterium]